MTGRNYGRMYAALEGALTDLERARIIRELETRESEGVLTDGDSMLLDNLRTAEERIAAYMARAEVNGD